jgi:hypothetical protein
MVFPIRQQSNLSCDRSGKKLGSQRLFIDIGFTPNLFAQHEICVEGRNLRSKWKKCFSPTSSAKEWVYELISCPTSLWQKTSTPSSRHAAISRFRSNQNLTVEFERIATRWSCIRPRSTIGMYSLRIRVSCEALGS